MQDFAHTLLKSQTLSPALAMEDVDVLCDRFIKIVRLILPEVRRREAGQCSILFLFFVLFCFANEVFL
jgi:hypothetical protein